MPEETKMPRRPNGIKVKWLESKDAGKMHRINVKHAEIMVGAEVVVGFIAKCYHGTVTDLLDWAPPKKKPKPSKVQKLVKEKENEKKKKNSAKGIHSTHSFW